jgi:hypothetical protein
MSSNAGDVPRYRRSGASEALSIYLGFLDSLDFGTNLVTRARAIPYNCGVRASKCENLIHTSNVIGQHIEIILYFRIVPDLSHQKCQ